VWIEEELRAPLAHTLSDEDHQHVLVPVAHLADGSGK
jgi:hypothetical protein